MIIKTMYFVTGLPATGKTHMMNQLIRDAKSLQTVITLRPKFFDLDSLATWVFSNGNESQYERTWELCDKAVEYLLFIAESRPVYIFGYVDNIERVHSLMRKGLDWLATAIIDPPDNKDYYVTRAIMRDVEESRTKSDDYELLYSKKFTVPEFSFRGSYNSVYYYLRSGMINYIGDNIP